MLRRGAVLLLVALLGCVRPARIERRDQPVEAGVPVPFVSDTELAWDFGDGSAVVLGAQVSHAFPRSGRYTVRGRDGSTLREQISIVVAPRPVLHLVPPDVELALLARGLDELGPAVDFMERLAGPDNVHDALEANPAVAWAVEQGIAGGGPLDAREGLALFVWPGTGDVLVTAVGVADDDAALKAFTSWLDARGWSRVSVVLGLTRYEREARALDVFLDRGALYVVDAPITGRLPSAQARVASASALGLEAQGPTEAMLDALPAGGLVVFLRAPEGSSWSTGAVALRIDGDELRAEGSLEAARPLWADVATPATRLLQKAPQGPIAVVSGMLGADALAALVLGPAGSGRRARFERELAEDGVELSRVLAGLGAGLDVLVYADVEGFVRGTLAAGGKPRPRVSLLLEAPVVDAAVLEPQLDAWLGAKLSRLEKLKEAQLRLWRGEDGSGPLDVALTDKALFVKGGAPIDAREPVNLLAEYAARFDGAFGPGHLSALIDVGRLRQELLQPRLMDVDPRKALTAQALAVTILDRFTRLELAMVDVAPAPTGAKVQAVIRLRQGSRANE